jgi:hypothetical protein
VLKRAAGRRLRNLRLERGILAYLEGKSSTDAAIIAGTGRAEFLMLLVEKGIVILDGPSTIQTELEFLASRLENERLALAARSLGDNQI